MREKLLKQNESIFSSFSSKIQDFKHRCFLLALKDTAIKKSNNNNNINSVNLFLNTQSKSIAPSYLWYRTMM